MGDWIGGTALVLLPWDQLGSYPRDGAGRPKKPAAAFACEGDGWRGVALHDPEATTFLPLENGGLFAQLIFLSGRDQARAALAAAVPQDGWKQLDCTYHATCDEHLLFPVSSSGAELEDPITLEILAEMGAPPIQVTLPPGEYSVSSLVGHAPDRDTEWTLVRLTRR